MAGGAGGGGAELLNVVEENYTIHNVLLTLLVVAGGAGGGGAELLNVEEELVVAGGKELLLLLPALFGIRLEEVWFELRGRKIYRTLFFLM